MQTDTEKYRHFFTEFGMSDDQISEYLAHLSLIVDSIVDTAWGMESTQLALMANANAAIASTKHAGKPLITHQSTFNDAAHTGR